MSDAWKELLVDHLRGTRRRILPGVEARCRKRLQASEPLLRLIPSAFETRLREEVDDALVAGFQKTTKERTANSIAFIFWQSLRNHLLKGRQPPVNLAVIASTFGVSTSNLSRWERKTVPSANKFFVAALTWSIDVRQLSAGRAAPAQNVFDPACYDWVASKGLAVAVQQIRVRELDERYACMGLDELACVGAVKRDGEGIGLLPGVSTNPTAVAERIIVRSPRMPVRNAAEVVKIARTWLTAYALFDEVRPDWSCLNGK
jgi:hypothetical protein